MAYTAKSLERDLPGLNAKLAAVGGAQRMENQGRNGYTAVDLYRGNSCEHTLATGTPRECYHACLEYIVGHINVGMVGTEI